MNELISSLSPLGLTFLISILACSIIGLTVSLYKFYKLFLNKAVSPTCEAATINFEQLNPEVYSDQLALYLKNQNSKDKSQLTALAEAKGRSYVLAWESGLNVLEVIVTIAPLLGLLGTASGLLGVFLGIGGEGGEANNAEIASGISTALITTIAGLGVAVPIVIFHSSFVRKIEILKSELEQIGAKIIQQISA